MYECCKSTEKKIVIKSLRVPNNGIASDVFVMWLATNREKTVCDSKIVTSAKVIQKYTQK